MNEKEMAQMFARAGQMIGNHVIIREEVRPGVNAYHVRWQYTHGQITCYSRGGSGSARYEWEFIPN